jgi:hypothetical protein
MSDFKTDFNSSVLHVFEVIVSQMQQVQDPAERVNSSFTMFKNQLN